MSWLVLLWSWPALALGVTAAAGWVVLVEAGERRREQP